MNTGKVVVHIEKSEARHRDRNTDESRPSVSPCLIAIAVHMIA